ncbi:MAG: hypothetical protein FWF59_00600 [Turicibacter sp.]|nr:hypothetical protein [Turicibacter sp.]
MKKTLFISITILTIGGIFFNIWQSQADSDSFVISQQDCGELFDDEETASLERDEGYEVIGVFEVCL